MANTVAEVLNDLALCQKDLEEWDCGEMLIPVTTSLTDHSTVNINFTDTMGHRKKVPKPEKRDDINCYWLHRDWNDHLENTRVGKIIPLFVNAASRAGFKIVGCWQKEYDKIIFRCQRGRRNNEHVNQEQ